MAILKTIQREASKYIDLSFFLRFIGLLVMFYYANMFYIAIIDTNGRIYNAFLNEHLNYIDWIRNSMLHTANAMSHVAGIDSSLSFPYRLTTVKGSYVEIVYECMGFGLFSFWMAFVLANTGSRTSKISWCILGITSIWFINCCRITILLLAFEKHWKFNLPVDHHTLFCMVAYTLITFLIMYYIKVKKIKTVNSKPKRQLIQ